MLGMSNKGLKGPAGGFVSIMILVILGVAVAIPITTQVIEDANLTGTTATVVQIIPVLLGVGILLAVVAFY